MIQSTENFYQLLFELSNEDRFNILFQLTKGETNITTLSKILDLTSQEVSRQVSRLADVGLLQKNVNGLNISDYGKLILRNIEGLQFITGNVNYFMSRDMSHLPDEFVNRIGELEDSDYVNDISSAFYRVNKIIREAEEYIYTITDQYQINSLPLIKDAFERNVQVKNIESKNFVVSPIIREAWIKENLIQLSNVWDKARNIGLLNEKIIEKPTIYLYMSEKEVAGLSFPLSDGKFDYHGFSGKSSKLHKWCRELFQYYWDNAKLRSTVIDELYSWMIKKPEIIKVFKLIAENRKIDYDNELVKSLEEKGLILDGNLTHIGDFVYGQLEKKPPYEER